jgi:hypothetical protein
MYIFQITQKILQKLLLGLFSYGRSMKDFSHPSDLVNLVLQGKLLIPPPLKNVDVIFGWPLFQNYSKFVKKNLCTFIWQKFSRVFHPIFSDEHYAATNNQQK